MFTTLTNWWYSCRVQCEECGDSYLVPIEDKHDRMLCSLRCCMLYNEKHTDI